MTAKPVRPRRYGAAEAESFCTGGSPLNRDAARIAHTAATTGDDTALSVLADLLQDNDHPAAEIVRRAATHPERHEEHVPAGGYQDPHAPAEGHTSARLQTHKGDYPWWPTDHVVLPKFNEAKTDWEQPNEASVLLNYFNHPNGHFFRVDVASHADGTGGRRIFVPTTPQEAAEYGRRTIANGGDRPGWRKTVGEHFIRTAAAPPGYREANYGDFTPPPEAPAPASTTQLSRRRLAGAVRKYANDKGEPEVDDITCPHCGHTAHTFTFLSSADGMSGTQCPQCGGHFYELPDLGGPTEISETPPGHDQPVPLSRRRVGVKRYSEQGEMKSFHAGMQEQPDDITNHLVYADWLEDHGKPAHADVIRTENAKEKPDRYISTFPSKTWGWGAHTKPGDFFVFSHGKDSSGLTLQNHSLHKPGTAFWWDRVYDSEEERDAAFDRLVQEGAVPNPDQAPVAPTDTEINDYLHTPPTALSRRRYAAYAAPVGGIVVRGSFYDGGERIPKPQGSFVNPPIRKAEGETPTPATTNTLPPGPEEQEDTGRRAKRRKLKVPRQREEKRYNPDTDLLSTTTKGIKIPPSRPTPPVRRRKMTTPVKYAKIKHKIEPDQGDGFKITTPYGRINYRPVPHEDRNEIWWVESHKKNHGSELVDLMQHYHPAGEIAWGATSQSGEGLRQRWHAAHPEVAGGEGKSYPHEGQFDPFDHGDDEEEDKDYDDEEIEEES